MISDSDWVECLQEDYCSDTSLKENPGDLSETAEEGSDLGNSKTFGKKLMHLDDTLNFRQRWEQYFHNEHFKNVMGGYPSPPQRVTTWPDAPEISIRPLRCHFCHLNDI